MTEELFIIGKLLQPSEPLIDLEQVLEDYVSRDTGKSSFKKFSCSDHISKIPETWLCDGITDCQGGEDENKANCPPTLSGQPLGTPLNIVQMSEEALNVNLLCDPVGYNIHIETGKATCFRMTPIQLDIQPIRNVDGAFHQKQNVKISMIKFLLPDKRAVWPIDFLFTMGAISKTP